jgi:hypothetical protein
MARIAKFVTPRNERSPTFRGLAVYFVDVSTGSSRIGAQHQVLFHQHHTFKKKAMSESVKF